MSGSSPVPSPVDRAGRASRGALPRSTPVGRACGNGRREGATGGGTGGSRAPAPSALLAVVSLALGGCSTLGDAFSVEEVRPWERGTLAREDMQLVLDPMDESVDEHMYFSKEASSGGGRVRGGGCGCN